MQFFWAGYVSAGSSPECSVWVFTPRIEVAVGADGVGGVDARCDGHGVHSRCQRDPLRRVGSRHAAITGPATEFAGGAITPGVEIPVRADGVCIGVPGGNSGRLDPWRERDHFGGQLFSAPGLAVAEGTVSLRTPSVEVPIGTDGVGVVAE